MSKSTAFLARFATATNVTEGVAIIRREYPAGFALSSQDKVALTSIATRKDVAFSVRRVCLSKLKHARTSPDLFDALASATGLCSECRCTLTGEIICPGCDPGATIGDTFGARRKTASVKAYRRLDGDGWEWKQADIAKYCCAIPDGYVPLWWGFPNTFKGAQGMEYREKTNERTGRVTSRFHFEYLARQNADKVCRGLTRDGSYPRTWEFLP